jgi:hypothetical protein
MDVDRRLEQLCERVTLVEGVGSLRRGELCVMSFVALLAGEHHTDHPATASPLIRNLAIPINDAMPQEVRQCLKPFAARIVGTNGGCDRARAEVLRQALAGEILPRIRRDWGAGRVSERCCAPLEFLFAGAAGFAGAVGGDFETRVALSLAEIERGIPPGYEPCLGSATGELLVRCMREATTPEQRSWYWDEAISLLDRLCDIAEEPRRQTIRDDRIARAEERLGSTWLDGFRWLMPATYKVHEPF